MNKCNICKFNIYFCICKTSKPSISIFQEKRKYGKKITLISGFKKDDKMKSVLKLLKKKLSVGGTYKNGNIELQGKEVNVIYSLLEKEYEITRK